MRSAASGYVMLEGDSTNNGNNAESGETALAVAQEKYGAWQRPENVKGQRRAAHAQPRETPQPTFFRLVGQVSDFNRKTVHRR